MANSELERADFHTHLGNRSNEDFIQEALENNVKVVVALDRGSVVQSGKLESLIGYGMDKGVVVLPGVESFVKATIGGEQIGFELIGVGFDIKNPAINEVFSPFVPQRFHDPKVKFQSEFLRSLGLDISRNAANEKIYQEIDMRVPETARRLCEIAVLNTNNLALLQSSQWQEKLAAQFKEHPEIEGELATALYWEFFADGRPGYFPGSMSLELVRDTIHNAGGIVIAAHPKLDWGVERHLDLKDLISYWLDNGIDGLEGWDAGPLDIELANEAKKRGKLVLGGSGRDKDRYSNRVMGKGDIESQDMFIPVKVFDKLQAYRRRRALNYEGD